jgi:hypothetical protein
MTRPRETSKDKRPLFSSVPDSIEKLAVASGPDQDKQFVGHLVNEQPISTKVAFTMVFPVSRQLVIAEVWRQGLFILKQFSGLEKSGHITARALDTLKVLLKVPLVNDFAHQVSKSALSAFTEEKRGKPSRGSFIASRVAAFGSAGSSMSKVTTARAGPVTGSQRVTTPSAETVASTVFKVADTSGVYSNL